MPNKPMQVRRWQIVVAFILLTLSFVITLFVWNEQVDQNVKITNEKIKRNKENIELIQNSRLLSCQTTYSILRDLINLNVSEMKKNQNGKLTERQKTIIDKYYERLDSTKCLTIVQPPKVKTSKG